MNDQRVIDESDHYHTGIVLLIHINRYDRTIILRDMTNKSKLAFALLTHSGDFLPFPMLRNRLCAFHPS